MKKERKLFHIFFGVISASLIYFEIDPIYFCFASLLTFLFELIRLKNKKINKFFLNNFSFMMKKEERNKFTAILPYLLGISLISFLDKDIAILSVLFLAIGDPFASYMGIEYGHDSYRFENNKTLTGIYACYFICVLLSLSLGISFNWDLYKLLFIASTAPLVATISEFIILKDIDDNFLIPAMSGSYLYFACQYLV